VTILTLFVIILGDYLDRLPLMRDLRNHGAHLLGIAPAIPPVLGISGAQ
jgi:hypothetical protein